MFFIFIASILTLTLNTDDYQSFMVVQDLRYEIPVGFISKMVSGLKSIFSFFNLKRYFNNESFTHDYIDIEKQNYSKDISPNFYSFEYENEKDSKQLLTNIEQESDKFPLNKGVLEISQNNVLQESGELIYDNCTEIFDFEENKLTNNILDEQVFEEIKGETISFAKDLNFEPESVYTKNFKDYSRYKQFKNIYFNRNFRYFLHTIQESDY